MSEHTISIARDGEMYLVALVPPCVTVPPRLFETYKSARGYSSGLRLVNRWPVQDETGGDHV